MKQFETGDRLTRRQALEAADLRREYRKGWDLKEISASAWDVSGRCA